MSSVVVWTDPHDTGITVQREKGAGYVLTIPDKHGQAPTRRTYADQGAAVRAGERASRELRKDERSA